MFRLQRLLLLIYILVTVYLYDNAWEISQHGSLLTDTISSRKMGYWLELKSWMFRDPIKLIRYLVLFVCCIIVIVQLYECFSRLRTPPISTHSYYSLTDMIEMPAVTICRDPAYKFDVLSTLSRGTCLHPKYITCWKNYPYDVLELEEFFINSTFDESETFLKHQYGLDGLSENVDITSSIHFYLGRCHTVRPNSMIKRATRNSGYSMILRHHITQSESSDKYYESQPGWHIFLHDWRDNFTEINMRSSGRAEYVFAEINEEIEIKLESQYFSNVETRDKNCIKNNEHSDLKCGEICIWKRLAAMSNCSGPWMYDVPQEPCSDYKSMKNLTTEYGKVYNRDDFTTCDCIQPCETRLFSTYIQNRKSFNQPEPNTQVWIYYTTKLVSMIEEKPSYDTTQFIADIGGSLGFLLGLSVLGLIGILENITLFLCGGLIKKIQLKNEKRMKTDTDQRSERSDETVNVATIYNDKGENKSALRI